MMRLRGCQGETYCFFDIGQIFERAPIGTGRPAVRFEHRDNFHPIGGRVPVVVFGGVPSRRVECPVPVGVHIECEVQSKAVVVPANTRFGVGDDVTFRGARWLLGGWWA